MTESSSFWMLDPEVEFLNHGSFGSCPRPVLEFQQSLREQLERQPVRFLVREIEERLDSARTDVARFVGAQPENLVFVTNATTGINTVLRSVPSEPGDEWLVTNHEYNACRNALNLEAERRGVRVIVAEIPFPLQSSDEVVEAVLSRVTPRTRLALLDHVTSQTGLVLPIERLVRELDARGVDTLVDGAHAPGMVPLNLDALGAAYYTGNCHKWICAPKSAALLHVRPDRQAQIRPLVISHGANSPRKDRSRFQIEFGWMGTSDPSAILSVPEALRQIAALKPGGWPEVMRANRELALEGRQLLCEALEIPPPAPDEMIGSLASVPIPDGTSSEPPKSQLYLDPFQDWLMERHAIEVPVIPWPAPPRRLLRISAQLYNRREHYVKLAAALREAFAKARA